MKKCVVAILCVFSPILYAAEAGKSINCLFNGTLFSVIKDDISHYGKHVDLMVVGYNQQLNLKEPDFGDRGNSVGNMQLSKTIRILPKESDSRSDDDTYKHFNADETELYKKAQKKEVACPVLQVVEPRIIPDITSYETPEYDYYYTPERKIPSGFITSQVFTRRNAVINAGYDLGTLCYSKVLTEGLTILQNKENRIIAFDLLSARVGLPRDYATQYAFTAIKTFLTQNFGKYASVMLFVKKRSEFAEFKRLIDQYKENK